jgi:hypothetical protein
MKVIKSNTVTDTTLTTTDVPENDYAEWLVGTTYSDGDRVIVTTPNIHNIYESVQSANTGNDPVTDDGTWWTRVSSTNRWKMFNDVVQEQTTQADIIDVTITPAAVTTALAAINVDCASITIVMTDPSEGEVYNQTFPMTSYSGITNWYDYFFTAINRKKELSVLGLPPYASAVIDVTFNDSGETAKVGALVLGTSQISVIHNTAHHLVLLTIQLKKLTLRVEQQLPQVLILTKLILMLLLKLDDLQKLKRF